MSRIVDRQRIGEGGAGRIEARQLAVLIEKSMISVGRAVGAGDLAFIVDIEDLSVDRAWEVDRREGGH